MARETIEDFIDFDSPQLKRQTMAFVGTLRGMYEVVFKPRRVTRSQRANRYYFAAVVRPFFEFLRRTRSRRSRTASRPTSNSSGRCSAPAW
jgi:hypothetical protein